MSERTEAIRAALIEAFAPQSLQIEDESWKHAGHAGARESGGGHFVVDITADCFAGRSRIESHRMVNTALKPLFGPDIHALSIRARAPE